MLCRFCKTELEHVFIDLVNSPASNSFLTKEQLNEPENFFPLKVYTCHECFLVQVDEYKKSDAIFDSNYAYFSSYSTSWLEHAKKLVEKNIPICDVASECSYPDVFTFSKAFKKKYGFAPSMLKKRLEAQF